MDNPTFRRNRKLISKQQPDDSNPTHLNDEIQYLLFNSRCHDSGENVNFDSARQFKQEFMKINNKKSSDRLCLQSMRLGVNSIIVLANILAQRNYIEVLKLGDNLISDYGMNGIKSIISNCSIVSLDISSNMISEMGLEVIVDDLIKNTVLKSLHLGVVQGSPRKNSIKTQGAKYIAAILLHNKSIESLGLQDNDIDSEGLEIIGASLKQNDTLKRLKISENGVNTDTLQFILKNAYSLEEIDVSKNNISSKGGYQLRNFIENSYKIESLNLEYNQLYQEGIQQIAESIREHSQLSILNLRGNNISDRGLECLITSLTNNRSMKRLDISQNMLTAFGIQKLANVISTTNLQYLNIGNNNLGDESLIYLGDQLNNRIEIVRLQCLDISGSKIGDKGILYFLQQIQNNQELKYLLVNNNFISEQVSKFLINHLTQNRSLLQLQLQENRLSISCLRKVNNVLNRNKQLLIDEQPRRLEDDVNQLKFEQKKLQDTKNKINKQQKEISQLEEYKTIIALDYNRQIKGEQQTRNQSIEKVKQQVNAIEQKKLIIQTKEKEYMVLRQKQEDSLLHLRTKLKNEQDKESQLETQLEMLNKDMEFQDINFDKNINELSNQVKQLKQEGDLYDKKTQELNEQYQYLLTNKDQLNQSLSSSSQDSSPKLQVGVKRVQKKGKTNVI